MKQRLFIVEPNPAFGGGSERVCLDLARWLADRGHQIRLLHDLPGSMLPAYAEYGTQFHRLPLRPFGWRTLASSLRRANAIAQLLKKQRATGVLCSELHYIRLLALASRLSQVPVIFHLGLPATHAEWSWRSAYRNIAAGVSPSQHSLETWKNAQWPHDRLHMIPNWVDTNIGLSPYNTIITYVGTLAYEKGVDVLLQAFAQLRTQIPRLQLVFAGKDPLPPDHWANRASSLGIPPESVVMLGIQPNPEKVFAAADLAVIPSICEETFGLTLIEAMACATPVVTSTITSFTTILGPNFAHLRSPTNDPNALAQTLKRQLSNPGSLRELGPSLRGHILKHFSPAVACSAYEALLGKQMRKN